MKKQHIILTAMAATTLILPSCRVKMYDDNDDDGVKICKTLDQKDFNAIEIYGYNEVEYRQDSVYRVELIGTEKTLERALISVEDNTLLIKQKKNADIWGSGNRWTIKFSDSGYTVRVSAPDLQFVKINGAGDFEAKTPIRTESFRAVVSGSGDIELGQVTARHIYLDIAGSGSIVAAELNADKAKMTISGSGDINTDLVACKECSASIAGSGEIETAVKGCDTFCAEIAGSGEIEADLDACGSIEASTAGSGEITLMGSARSLKTSGRGIEAGDLVIIK